MLSASVLYRHEEQNTDNRHLYDQQSYYARNLINLYTQTGVGGALSYPVPKGGIIDNSTIGMVANNFRFQLNYDKRWKKGSLNIMTGSELRRSRTESYRNRYYGFQENISSVGYVDYTASFRDFIKGNLLQIPKQDEINTTHTNFVSYFVNGAYSYFDRYTVSFSARRDASNLFGLNTNDQWNPFWSAGLAWKLSDEKFYHLDFIPFLNLKATYGFSGNIDPSMSAVTTIYYGGTNDYYGSPFARFDNVYNPDLKWETSRMMNYALEFRLKGNILHGSIEHYRKYGKDLFGLSPVDYTTGIGSSVLKNAADMKGNGWDIKLGVTPVTGTFQWDITLNISNYKDKVVNNYLQTTAGNNYVGKDGNGLFGVPGSAVRGVFAYRWAGLNPENGNPTGYLNGEKSENYRSITTTGTAVYDLRYFGSAMPTWFGSVINRFHYRKWDLDFSLQYKLGYYFHRSSINYYNLFNYWIGNSDFSKRWQKTGDEAMTNVPSMTYPESSARSNFYAGSETLVEKGDHIRLRYVNLQYTLPLDSKKNISLYLNATDLGLLWKANRQGLDPDYNLGDYAVKPASSYSFGIRFNY